MSLICQAPSSILIYTVYISLCLDNNSNVFTISYLHKLYNSSLHSIRVQLYVSHKEAAALLLMWHKCVAPVPYTEVSNFLLSLSIYTYYLNYKCQVRTPLQQ